MMLVLLPTCKELQMCRRLLACILCIYGRWQIERRSKAGRVAAPRPLGQENTSTAAARNALRASTRPAPPGDTPGWSNELTAEFIKVLSWAAWSLNTKAVGATISTCTSRAKGGRAGAERRAARVAGSAAKFLRATASGAAWHTASAASAATRPAQQKPRWLGGCSRQPRHCKLRSNEADSAAGKQWEDGAHLVSRLLDATLRPHSGGQLAGSRGLDVRHHDGVHVVLLQEAQQVCSRVEGG